MQLRTTLVLASVLMVASAGAGASGLASSSAHGSESSATLEHIQTNPPSSTECTEITDGHVRIGTLHSVTGFQPDCVLIDNGDRITFENRDTSRFGAHDPGDGPPGDENGAFCWQSDDFSFHNGLPPRDVDSVEGPTFGFNVHWNGSRINLSEVTYDGEARGDLACGDETSNPIWEWNEDIDGEDEVAIHYVCHLHEDHGAGWILIDV